MLGAVFVVALSASALAAPPSDPAGVVAPAPVTSQATVKPQSKFGVVGNEALLKLIRTSPIFAKNLNAPGKPLRGFADLHTHPMAHLGFGGHVIHGAPDVDVLMAPGTIYNAAGQGASGATCNGDFKRAASVAEALGTSYSTHRGHDFFKNKCGNHVRQIVLGEVAKKYRIASFSVERPLGHPTFVEFPAHNDILHQQMWVDWIRRAKEGGLRVMVGLAVNSRALAVGVEANPPVDDKESGDLQIKELIRFVGRHSDFMEVARSAADLRRIVEQDKLAVVVGVELDDIGNFAWSRKAPSEAQVRAEVQRLHGLGVRYAFPVHLTDNFFGGSAVYENELAAANKFQTGNWFDLECSSGEGINRRIESNFDVFKLLKLGDAGGNQPLPSCQMGEGFKNKRGLSALGRAAINEMMKLGMVIDVDHMSQRTVSEVIEFTGSTPGGAYPLVSGHNGLRGKGGSENSRTVAQYEKLASREGLAGVGFNRLNARDFTRNATAIMNVSSQLQLTLGSDVNGMEALPRSQECQQAKDLTVTVPGDAWKKDPAQLQCNGRVIEARAARIGCLDIQKTPNLTRLVQGACGGKSSCTYKAPTPEQYRKAGVRAAERAFCTQAMEIRYRCVPKEGPTVCVDYSKFPQARMGSRSWDYNEEGVVHIGLFPDFLKHVESLEAEGGPALVDELFNGAEGFAKLWARAETVGKAVR